jgi:hypothetical protein
MTNAQIPKLITPSTMITAAQAREKAEASNATLDKICSQIGEEISVAADLGKRELILNDAFPMHEAFEIANTQYHAPAFTSWQTLLSSKLTKFGYTMRATGRYITVGGGFKSIDDVSRTETEYVLRVSW